MTLCKALLFLIFVAVVVACGATSSTGAGEGPAPAGLVGTWRATKAEFVSADDPNTKVDVVAKGTRVTLELQASTFTLTEADPDIAARETTGTWTASSDLLTMTPSGMPFSWVFQLASSGDDLSLTGGSVEFDFNLDGANEQAKLNLALVRVK
jgi:hypothetical protein